jgi:hypothetical protein
MTDAVGRSNSRPVDTLAIEQRVKSELQRSYDDGAQVRSDLDATEQRYQQLIDDNDASKSSAALLKTLGVTAASAVTLGGIGALVGRFGAGGRTLAGAGTGAVVGAALALAGAGLATWVGTVFDDNQQDLPDTAEFEQVSTRRDQLQRAVDEQPDPQRIEPGSGWLPIPLSARNERDGVTSNVQVDGWVGEIMSAQDHDGDGQISLNASELQRSVVGGAFSPSDATDPAHVAKARNLPLKELTGYDADKDGRISDSEVATMLSTPKSIEDSYGLTKPQLERFDTGHDGRVSRAELTEGIVRDAATEYHGLYFTTNVDGSVPRSIGDMRDGWHAAD